MLYQRYFLRMNQSSTTHILSLLLTLVLSLAAVHIILIPMDSTSQLNRILQRNRYNDTINTTTATPTTTTITSNISHLSNQNVTENSTNSINSQKHFLRLNHNYSTDNETGK